MSLMRRSDLCILAVDDRIRGVLQSESTSKGNGKNQNVRSPRVGKPSQRSQRTIVGRASSRLDVRRRQAPSGPGGKGKKSDKGKGKSKPQNTSLVGKSKGKSTGKGKQTKDQAFMRKGQGKGKNKKSFTDGDKTKGKDMHDETILELSTCEAHTMLRRLGGKGLKFLHIQLSPAAPC